jgi:surface antigen
MKNLFTLILISVMSIGCASGSNPYMNNSNMGGLIGGVGGAVGGALLGKNLEGGAKIASIGGGAILGMLLGNKVGTWFDEKDKKRNYNLIQKVLEENQDNETGTIQYSKSWKNPNTGQTQTGMVTQSATPQNTHQDYQQRVAEWANKKDMQRNQYPQNDVEPLRNRNQFGIPQKYNKSQLGLNNESNGFCRNLTIDIEISGLTATPQKTQFYKFCRSESGWRQVS